MPTDATPAMIVVAIFEGGFFLAGLWALWDFQFSPRAREARRGPRTLPFGGISSLAFAQGALCVISGAILVQASIAQVVRRFFPQIESDVTWWTVIVGSGTPLGALAGLLIARFLPRNFERASEPDSSVTTKPIQPRKFNLVAAGLIVFIAAMPIVDLLAIGWQFFLELLSVSAEKQPLLDIFSKTHDPVRVGTMVFFTVVVAPIAEELVFRAGVFRFLRTRLPPTAAIVISAAIFAVLHFNLLALPPLFVLGIVFAVAYERTGKIVVPMIAHGLFNLNTVLLLLAGVTV